MEAAEACADQIAPAAAKVLQIKMGLVLTVTHGGASFASWGWKSSQRAAGRRALATRVGSLNIVAWEDQMKPIVVLGILLIVLGALALAYQGITYKSRKKVLNLGSIQATTTTEKTIPLPPLLGGLVFAGGIVLVVVGRKKRH